MRRSFFFPGFLLIIIHSLSKVAELQPQLSPDILKMMEQRLSAIEQRSACLQNLIDRVNVACIYVICSGFCVRAVKLPVLVVFYPVTRG